MDLDHLKQLTENIKAAYTKDSAFSARCRHQLPSLDEVKTLLTLAKSVLFPYDLTQLDEQILKLANYLETMLEKSFNTAKSDHIETIITDFLSEIPTLRSRLKQDAQAHFDGDPAAKSIEEVLVAYPGFKAITGHRLAHFFYTKEVPLLPRLMGEWIHQETGVDIHPGATIGHHFCIDHGTGIVVGETATIGNHVKLYQGVTLGALSVPKKGITGKRHPTLDDHVTVYAGTTILGGDTVIGKHSVIGGNVWLTATVPPKSKVYIGNDKRQILKTEPLDISAIQGWGI